MDPAPLTNRANCCEALATIAVGASLPARQPEVGGVDCRPEIIFQDPTAGDMAATRQAHQPRLVDARDADAAAALPRRALTLGMLRKCCCAAET